MATSELLIRLNERLVGEQANYTVSRETYASMGPNDMRIPGPPAFTPTPVKPGKAEEYYRYLTELYSPVAIQKIAHKPQFDVPVFLNYDGNDNPRDNVDNEPRFRPHYAGLHGEVTAETDDSFYLLYCFYHISDYDHPIREIISKESFHDSDDEGLMIRVDKKSMQVTEAEGWFHNRFFLCNRTGETAGNQPIPGRLFFEKDTHLIVYCQSLGHGVRPAQSMDMEYLKNNVAVLRYRPAGERVPFKITREPQYDLSYDLQNFDRWYAFALGPIGSKGRGEGMFEDTILLGRYADGKEMRIGRFIATKDFEKKIWARPKPPWSWEDAWDDIPIFVWHFFPSYAFEMHFGLPLSHRYLSNRPVEKVFGMKPEKLYGRLELRVGHNLLITWDSMKKYERRPNREQYWQAARILMKRYLNRLFFKLG